MKNADVHLLQFLPIIPIDKTDEICRQARKIATQQKLGHPNRVRPTLTNPRRYGQRHYGRRNRFGQTMPDKKPFRQTI